MTGNRYVSYSLEGRWKKEEGRGLRSEVGGVNEVGGRRGKRGQRSEVGGLSFISLQLFADQAFYSVIPIFSLILRNRRICSDIVYRLCSCCDEEVQSNTMILELPLRQCTTWNGNPFY
jgi:hypothetical protein